MNITLICKFPPESWTSEKVWSESVAICGRLAAVHESLGAWWTNPRKPKDVYVPLTERERFVARVEEDDAAMSAEFPSVSTDGSDGVLLTNVGSDKEWAKRGGITLSVMPRAGHVRLHVDRLEKLYADPGEVIFAAMKALLSGKGFISAQTNVQQLVDKQLLLYSIDRAPFQHRDFLGWMGYVPSALTAEQVPEAEKLERSGTGTLVLSTELLDLGTPAAIKQANQVEMRLADLDLLPVLDDALR